MRGEADTFHEEDEDDEEKGMQVEIAEMQGWEVEVKEAIDIISMKNGE